MKTQLTFLAALVAMALTFAACKTVAPNQPTGFLSADTNGVLYVAGNAVTTNGVEQSLKLAAIAGAQAVLGYDANCKPYLQAVAEVFSSLLNDGIYDPAIIRLSLEKVSLNGANDPNVINSVNGVLILYQTFFAAATEQKIDNVSPYLIPALRGIRDGLLTVVKP